MINYALNFTGASNGWHIVYADYRTGFASLMLSQSKCIWGSSRRYKPMYLVRNMKSVNTLKVPSNLISHHACRIRNTYFFMFLARTGISWIITMGVKPVNQSSYRKLHNNDPALQISGKVGFLKCTLVSRLPLRQVFNVRQSGRGTTRSD
jgi:hypothetical protein